MVGVNAHSQDYVNHPASGFASIGTVVSCTFTSGSKRNAHDIKNGEGGDFFTPEELAEAKLICQLFSDNTANNLPPPVLQEIIDNVEVCPPSIQQVSEDVRFHQDPNNDNCRLQVCPFLYESPTTSFSFVQQCCYDTASNG